MKLLFLSFCSFFFVNLLQAQELPEYTRLEGDLNPIEIAEFVANNIINQSNFSYEYGLMKPSPDLEFINYGESLDNSKPGVAYALSTIYSESDQNLEMEVGSTSGTKIWVNDKLVFKQEGDYKLAAKIDEQSYVLPDHFTVNLKKGENKILIKSAYSGKGEWQLFMQHRNMGYYADKGKKITTSLKKYAPNIDLKNWLILGCFENFDGNGLDFEYEPERIIEFYKIYKSGENSFTWDIPRVHLITQNPGGGKFYRWVYHVGGFMWGLQHLSKETNNSKYNDFVSKWCDYTLKTMPLVDYQMEKLVATRSLNWKMLMLDYTTAPSLPFLARLINDTSFPEKEAYKKHIDNILNYVQNEQYRLPNGLFARNYMAYPTVWADDMFMGTPFLLQSAEYTKDASEKKELYDDATNQIIETNKLLFDKDKKLYRQAIYVGHPEQKVPFWSRGNGWAIWATSETLLHLPKNHKNYKKILRIFRNHIDGIIKAQDSDGFWHNILDMPETVRESSGATIFTLCIARGINNGWLNKKEYGPILEKGWSALKTFISQDGNMYGVKAGTNFSTDPKDYENVPFYKSDTHGIFPLLFTCIEMDQYYNSKK